jgi:hypothetical protein
MTTTTPKLVYVPGVCNIGPGERAQRRRIGIFGAVTTIIVLVILLVLHAPLPWRLILLLPAFGAATGFIQDRMHFCVGFGMKGLYNVLHAVGTTDSVTQAEFRAKDRQRAIEILVLSAAFALIITALAMLV